MFPILDKKAIDIEWRHPRNKSPAEFLQLTLLYEMIDYFLQHLSVL